MSEALNPIAAPAAPASPTAPVSTETAPSSFNLATASDADMLAHYGAQLRGSEPAESADPAPDAAGADTATAAADDEITFDEAVGRHRDKTGRFVKPDGTPDEDAPGAEAAEVAPNEPTEPAKPKPFRVLDADGELDVPEGVTVEFKLAGKMKQATLPELVRMAQSGGYQEGLKQEVEQARAQQQTFAQREQQYQHEIHRVQAETQQALAQIEQQIAAFYSDPDLYEAARQQYAAQNSPESRAERAEQQLRAWQEAQQHQQATAFAQQQVATLIAPRVQTALDQYGSTVSYEEVMGKFALLTDPMKVQGTLPPHRLADAAAILDRELLPWAASLHEQRTTSQRHAQAAQDAQRQALEAQIAAAKRQAHEAKRGFARATKPAGAASADAPPPKPIKTAEDAVDRILERAAQQLRG